MENISIQTYTFRDYMTNKEDFITTMRRIADMGYKTVQIREPEFMHTKELADLLKSLGLKADSVMCAVYDIPDSIDKIVDAAKVLDTDMVRCDSIRNEDRYSVEGYESFAEHLNICGRLLREKGLNFMYHFHSFEFIKLGDKRGIDILMENTDPKLVMFQPDVFWLAAAGCEPSRALESFAGRTHYMHLKDYIIVANNDSTLEAIKNASAPVGDGNLCWDEIIETARKIGINNFVVEDDMGSIDPFESAQRSITALKKFLGK